MSGDCVVLLLLFLCCCFVFVCFVFVFVGVGERAPDGIGAADAHCSAFVGDGVQVGLVLVVVVVPWFCA